MTTQACDLAKRNEWKAGYRTQQPHTAFYKFEEILKRRKGQTVGFTRATSDINRPFSGYIFFFIVAVIHDHKLKTT